MSPVDHAVVDDVGVEGRQIEVADALHQHDHEDGADAPPVRPQIRQQQFLHLLSPPSCSFAARSRASRRCARRPRRGSGPSSCLSCSLSTPMVLLEILLEGRPVLDLLAPALFGQEHPGDALVARYRPRGGPLPLFSRPCRMLVTRGRDRCSVSASSRWLIPSLRASRRERRPRRDASPVCANRRCMACRCRWKVLPRAWKARGGRPDRWSPAAARAADRDMVDNHSLQNSFAQNHYLVKPCVGAGAGLREPARRLTEKAANLYSPLS